MTQKFVKPERYSFEDVPFRQLMNKRIYKVLILCSTYDYFILEEDGRIDEQIFNEYVSLNLRYPPQFVQASTSTEAFHILETEKVDLVIAMLSISDVDTFKLAREIKTKYFEKPIVVLTPFSREVSIRLSREDLSAIDYVFSWLGNADLLLAIIKLIEDGMNVENDVNKVGVQVIMLVEDSIRYYSSYLPNLYKIIFQQSKEFTSEGLNDHQKTMRMRGRPKVLLATSYNQAIAYFNKYKNNMLGIISDMSFPKDGVKEKLAGLKLFEEVRSADEFMPFLMQSSDLKNREIADNVGVNFIHKYSKTLSLEVRDYVKESLSFGDFKVIDPKTNTVLFTISDLQGLQQKLFEIPDESLQYHFNRNDISKWLYARATFPLAELFKHIRSNQFDCLDSVKQFLYDTISEYRLNKGRGIIAKFYRESFDEYLNFSRIGEGSLGGKARGLAFIDSLIKRNKVFENFENVVVTIPRTVVLSTDVFDEYMESNCLYDIALSNSSDDVILHHFIKAKLPIRIHDDLQTFITFINNPIAVRSSSLLEDSHYQPFAGVYSTYMIPKIKSDKVMIEKLSEAIKSVYASVFFKGSKAYMAATRNVIDEEKMGIVLQEVCGKQNGDRFYPSISGVARSINFYPIPPEKPEDGIANIAIGLGKYIVDGGANLRFSPKYPQKVLQLSSTDMALKETQKYFYALDLNSNSFTPSTNDAINILKLRISEAEKDGMLTNIASTYDIENNCIKDGMFDEGQRVITFSNILNYNKFPLAKILETILEIGQREMSDPVEIEFAVDLNSGKNAKSTFNLLQIRPIVENEEAFTEEIEHIDPESTIITSKSALGDGIIKDIYDFVYVKPKSFNASKTNEIVRLIEKLNDKFVAENKNYVLVGPGRWGSSDPWLGIPVKWAQISAARVIIESGLENYRIDPSQGTHFFQNLTSFRVGYFTINPFIKDGHYDIDYLEKQEPAYEDDYIRHVQFSSPIIVKIDGKKSLGIILKPEGI
ncbi:MAG TPA: phosphoenolpyruvate synthase [Bacteroidales bacterium]|nr:MAG: phosphoenolpyruvate synthase [Bacteroidetes bacterium GWF2_33_38]OFY73279.1 MAG: phosphoenolpyruvate synthase [Bacteroidetes bacterium RIFOXYA12_FULL_33_9]HBF89195.1 phosphoenolpyruvate synthase [Bacteroidales bacterium]